MLGEQEPLVVVADLQQFGDALADEIDHLADAHEDAERAGHDHEQHEDLLFCRATDEAVDGVGARLQRTLGQPKRKESSFFSVMLKMTKYYAFI